MPKPIVCGGREDFLACDKYVDFCDPAVLSLARELFAGEDEQGRPWGLLRAGTVDQQPLEAFLDQVKARLQAQGLRYVDGGKPVQTVAVGGGACADELPAVLRAGCDTFVTADVRYNEFYDAKAAGVNLIDAGHFATENPVVAVLAAKLRAAFPQIPVECAENHRDYMNFYG